MTTVAIQIPQPQPTGRERVETTYSVHRYGSNTDSRETSSLEQAIRDWIRLGTETSELRAYEFQRDFEDDPCDLYVCTWNDESETWGRWHAVRAG